MRRAARLVFEGSLAFLLGLALGFGLLFFGVVARAETASFALSDAALLTASCPSPRVLRKGPDLLIRCADRPDPWLTIRNFAVNCPMPRATADRAGNLTLRCT